MLNYWHLSVNISKLTMTNHWSLLTRGSEHVNLLLYLLRYVHLGGGVPSNSLFCLFFWAQYVLSFNILKIDPQRITLDCIFTRSSKRSPRIEFENGPNRGPSRIEFGKRLSLSFASSFQLISVPLEKFKYLATLLRSITKFILLNITLSLQPIWSSPSSYLPWSSFIIHSTYNYISSQHFVSLSLGSTPQPPSL